MVDEQRNQVDRIERLLKETRDETREEIREVVGDFLKGVQEDTRRLEQHNIGVSAADALLFVRPLVDLLICKPN